MTTAEILTAINSISNDDRTSFEARRALEALASQVAEKVRYETAAEAGRAGVVRTISKMLADAGKSREALGGTWKDAEGRQCMCDGYRAYRLLEPLPLPAIREGLTPLALEKCFPPASIVKTGKPLQLPDRKRLRAFIKLQRALYGRTVAPLWSFGDGLPATNAQYLLELLDLMPDARLYCKDTVSPLYAVSELGDAVLLPVRVAYDRQVATSYLMDTARNRSTDETPEFMLSEFAAVMRAAANA